MAYLFRFITLSATLAFAGDRALADTDIYVNSAYIAEIEIGVFCNVEIIGTEVAPDTDLGLLNIIGPPARQVSRSTIVPMVKGLFFGVRSRAADGQTLAGVRFRNTHPPFLHNGSTSGEYEGGIIPDKLVHQLYAFDFDYEMVTGPWVFEAFQGDTLLYRIPFSLVPPSDAPNDLFDACDDVDLIS